jgi:probable phosphoglycerate mutase
VQTAEVLSHTLSLRVEIEHDLKETDFGIWEGLTKDQACAAAREVFHAWESNPSAVGPPGGEPLHMALQRAQRLRGVVLGHGELTLLLVSHKSFLRIAICHWLGLDPALYRTLLDLEPAGLGCVSLTGQSGTLRLLNWTPTLESVTHRDP